ncbi:hypothetical protein LPJ38_01825 [Bradyrhizobium daqingense]|uniref:hypothetical protein n=1 Tax=Bradyrhizobium daqingense TaxID=993502 RepID=UPI0011A964D5|nr:hypothetical protein [Bradyrhizobium daqingense]UFS89552.1 hypothetical protein LPJ38_01825 [Bradyrhizobium daqingense]
MTFAVDDEVASLFKVFAFRAALLDLGNQAQVEFVGRFGEARLQTNKVAVLWRSGQSTRRTAIAPSPQRWLMRAHLLGRQFGLSTQKPPYGGFYVMLHHLCRIAFANNNCVVAHGLPKK